MKMSAKPFNNSRGISCRMHTGVRRLSWCMDMKRRIGAAPAATATCCRLMRKYSMKPPTTLGYFVRSGEFLVPLDATMLMKAHSDRVWCRCSLSRREAIDENEGNTTPCRQSNPDLMIGTQFSSGHGLGAVHEVPLEVKVNSEQYIMVRNNTGHPVIVERRRRATSWAQIVATSSKYVGPLPVPTSMSSMGVLGRSSASCADRALC